jgi:protein required for attachment to host cells
MADKGLAHGVWVVVADGEKALVMVNRGDARAIDLEVVRKEEQDNPPAQDWATDRPGRMNDGAGGPHKSALEPTDWHQMEKDRFATDLAGLPYTAVHGSRFDTLVIIASQSTLGVLRKAFHQTVSEKIILELPKVLTNHLFGAIEEQVTTALDQI